MLQPQTVHECGDNGINPTTREIKVVLWQGQYPYTISNYNLFQPGRTPDAESLQVYSHSHFGGKNEPRTRKRTRANGGKNMPRTRKPSRQGRTPYTDFCRDEHRTQNEGEDHRREERAPAPTANPETTPARRSTKVLFLFLVRREERAPDPKKNNGKRREERAPDP